MIVEHAFTVNAPSERVLAALLDLRISVACLPGTRLLTLDGDTAGCRVRLPPGSAIPAYRGTLRLVDSDLEAGSLRAALRGTEPGGGTASGDVELRLRESNGLTTASLRGELEVDGSPAAVEPEALMRAATALLRRFGRRLEDSMARRAQPGAGVDPGERLEETIAALSQLERVTATGATPGPSAQAAAPAEVGVKPPPALPAAVEPAPVTREPDDRRVPGRVEVVTARPVPVPRNPTRRERAGNRIDDRPWVIPGALLTVLMLWLLSRRRD